MDGGHSREKEKKRLFCQMRDLQRLHQRILLQIVNNEEDPTEASVNTSVQVPTLHHYSRNSENNAPKAHSLEFCEKRYNCLQPMDRHAKIQRTGVIPHPSPATPRSIGTQFRPCGRCRQKPWATISSPPHIKRVPKDLKASPITVLRG